MPFVADKVMSLLTNILVKTGDDDEEPDPINKIKGIQKQKVGVMKGKIKTVARMQKMFGTLR